jgi:UDP-2,3-diacylglucosamine pyrophosphatase LpxH
MQELPKETLVVFVSDSHIGGDPGCDGFESPEKLQALLQELSEHQGPVELVLAGDFFDFLQISPPSSVTDRAELTINRPEYQEMFEALRGFAAGEQHRVVYIPGNHDAETWWNPQVQNTLRESGLVDEFALYYLASLGTDEKRFTIYCEHGNQFDPPNYIEDYTEPLDTPLGHHIVTDFARRIAPIGEISPGLNLSDIKNVYPVTDIPQWVASKYFYHALGRAVSYVVIPLILAYIAYRLVTLYLNISAENQSLSISPSYLALPRVHEAFLDTSFFILGLLVLLVILFLFLRHRVRKLLSAGFAQGSAEQGKATKSQEVEALVKDNGPFPMLEEDGPAIDVFVSGHTHKPGLKELERTDGSKVVMVNSGCWLRQLRPVGSHLRWPPVFASKFVLTHVRVFLRDSKLHVELWEHPKPATNPLTRTENLAAWGKMPDQPAPHAEPSVIAASEVTAPD